MTTRKHLWIVGVALLLAPGCAGWHSQPALPSRRSLVLDQLVIFSDTPLPEHHRLLEELKSQRTLVSTKLALPVSDEPIHVYLFPTAEKLDAFVRIHYPSMPERRAFFVESDTRLTVYAYWGDRVAEDLRHEVAHGYLHAVVAHLPLWLDEGLAEYFEVPRGQYGLNVPHLEALTGDANWRPDLERLEHLRSPGEMSQADYAESWAWIYYLLQSSPQHLDLLQRHLKSLGKSPSPEPLSVQLARENPDYKQALTAYLANLRQTSQ